MGGSRALRVRGRADGTSMLVLPGLAACISTAGPSSGKSAAASPAPWPLPVPAHSHGGASHGHVLLHAQLAAEVPPLSRPGSAPMRPTSAQCTHPGRRTSHVTLQERRPVSACAKPSPARPRTPLQHRVQVSRDIYLPPPGKTTPLAEHGFGAEQWRDLAGVPLRASRVNLALSAGHGHAELLSRRPRSVGMASASSPHLLPWPSRGAWLLCAAPERELSPPSSPGQQRNARVADNGARDAEEKRGWDGSSRANTRGLPSPCRAQPRKAQLPRQERSGSTAARAERARRVPQVQGGGPAAARRSGRGLQKSVAETTAHAAEATHTILNMAEGLLEQAAYQDVVIQQEEASPLSVEDAAAVSEGGGDPLQAIQEHDEDTDSGHTWTISSTDSTSLDRKPAIELPAREPRGRPCPGDDGLSFSEKYSCSEKAFLVGRSCSSSRRLSHQASTESLDDWGNRDRAADVFDRISYDGIVRCDCLEWALMFIGHVKPECIKVAEILEQCFGAWTAQLSKEQFLEVVYLYDRFMEEKMTRLFREADTAGSGYISTGEVSIVLRKFGLTPFRWVVDGLLEAARPRRGDGCSMEEFTALLHNISQDAGFTSEAAARLRTTFWRYESSRISGGAAAAGGGGLASTSVAAAAQAARAARQCPGRLDAAGLSASLRRLGAAGPVEGLPSFFHTSIRGAAEGERNPDGALTAFTEREFMAVMRSHKEHETRRIYEACSDEDTDRSGTVRTQRLSRLFEAVGYTAWCPKFIEDVAASCGFHEESKLLFEDVCLVHEKCQLGLGIRSAEMETIREAFQRYNYEEAESVDHAVVLGALRWLGYNVTPQSVLDIQLDVFGNSDFRMDFQDFLVLLARVRELEMQQLRAYLAKHGVEGEALETGKLKGVLKAVGCRLPDGFADHAAMAQQEDKCERGWLTAWEVAEYIAKERSRIRELVQEFEGLSDVEVNRFRTRFRKIEANGGVAEVAMHLSEFVAEVCHRVPKLVPWARKIFFGNAQDFKHFLQAIRFVTDRVEGDLLRKERSVVAEVGLSDVEVGDFHQLFRAADGDRTGTISFSAFGKLLSGVVPSSLADATSGELHARLRKSDSGGCGYLNFPDFILAIWAMQQDDWHGINGVAKAIVERDGKKGVREEELSKRLPRSASVRG